MTKNDIELEKFMAEVYSSDPVGYYNRFFNVDEDDLLEALGNFADECRMMLCVREQMLETKKERYV